MELIFDIACIQIEDLFIPPAPGGKTVSFRFSAYRPRSRSISNDEYSTLRAFSSMESHHRNSSTKEKSPQKIPNFIILLRDWINIKLPIRDSICVRTRNWKRSIYRNVIKYTENHTFLNKLILTNNESVLNHRVSMITRVKLIT